MEIPRDVAVFLQFVGVPYPEIDEDQVRELAGQVRSFADNVHSTHESASGAITDMGSVYSGYSYDQLLAVWASLSATHMRELDTACRVVAQALDVAAEMIVTVKLAVLAELAALATGYAALTAAAFSTGGLTAAMEFAVQTATRKLCEAMEQALVAYLLSDVAGTAIEPLRRVVDRLVDGVRHEAAARLQNSPPNASAPPLSIDPDEVQRYAGMLDAYAGDILGHARNFAARAADPHPAPAHAPDTAGRLDADTPVPPDGPTGITGGRDTLADEAGTHIPHHGASAETSPVTPISGSDRSAPTAPHSIRPGPLFPPPDTAAVAGPGGPAPTTPATTRPPPWTAPGSSSNAPDTSTATSRPDAARDHPCTPEQRDTPARPGEHPASTVPGRAPVTAGSSDDASSDDASSDDTASVAHSPDNPGKTPSGNRIGPPAPSRRGTLRHKVPVAPSPWARSRSAPRQVTSATNPPTDVGPAPPTDATGSRPPSKPRPRTVPPRHDDAAPTPEAGHTRTPPTGGN